MNQNQISGIASILFGSMQMRTGRMIGNPQLELRGARLRNSGSNQRCVGEAQELIKACIKRQRQSS